MIKLGIIGCPLAHSLSPAMHKAALQEKGIDGDYLILETPPEKLEERINYLKTSGFRGFNVTIPHKVAIMDFLDKIDDFALKVEAVNTVVIKDDARLEGYNTDVYGFVQAIPAGIRENLKEKKAVVLGSGGAARAVITGLADMGIKKIDIMARNKNKSEELINLSGKNLPGINVNYLPLKEKADLSGISIVVNTTPLGMHGKNEGISPLSEYSIGSLNRDAFLYDIVYRPAKTKLLDLAEKRGINILNGLDMLVLQGAKGFSLWTGMEAPIETMKQALLKIQTLSSLRQAQDRL